MKKTLHLIAYIILLILVQKLNLISQTYVDLNATGSNDGTSWSNAYTDLQTAIDAADDGDDLWIAEGLYLLSEILMIENKEINIYGSFAKSEASVDDRDFENRTIISGDVDNNDDPDNLETNSADNLHLVIYAESKGKVITLDGLTIEGGRGELEGTFANDKATGGGMIVTGNVNMKNCTVRNNMARFGAGIYIKNIIGGKPDIKLDNCTFFHNVGIKFGGAIYAAFGGTVFEVNECHFENNEAEFGAGILGGGSSADSKGLVTNTTFRVNKASVGGGMTWDDRLDGNIKDCIFEGNVADRGAGLSVSFGGEVEVDNSQFLKNNTTNEGLGGGVYVEHDSRVKVFNSTFNENAAIGAGGGLFSLGPDSDIQVSGSIFKNNQVNDPEGFGGGIFAQDKSKISIEDSDFEENHSYYAGGVYFDNCMNSFISNSTFQKNSSVFGGAVVIESCDGKIETCLFQENTSESGGGAIYVWDDGSIVLEDSDFIKNSCTEFWGGAVYIQGNQNKRDQVTACRFYQNEAVKSAGAIYHVTSGLDLVNNVFSGNMASGEGIGHALSTNQAGENPNAVNIFHNTSFEHGQGLGAFGFWASESSSINLANNIFSGDAIPLFIEDGEVAVNSLGGNLTSQDATEFLDHEKDLNNEDPLFYDPGNRDFRLQIGSPCIDAGVVIVDVTKDNHGFFRDNAPDIGAYELEATTSINNNHILEGQLKILGNPVSENLIAQWSSKDIGQIIISIMDITGNVLDQTIVKKDAALVEFSFSVNTLSAGSYLIQMTNGSQTYLERFVKI